MTGDDSSSFLIVIQTIFGFRGRFWGRCSHIIIGSVQISLPFIRFILLLVLAIISVRFVIALQRTERSSCPRIPGTGGSLFLHPHQFACDVRSISIGRRIVAIRTASRLVDSSYFARSHSPFLSLWTGENISSCRACFLADSETLLLPFLSSIPSLLSPSAFGRALRVGTRVGF